MMEGKGMTHIKQLQFRKTVFNYFNNICFSNPFFSNSESPQEETDQGKGGLGKGGLGKGSLGKGSLVKESSDNSLKHLVGNLSKFIITSLVCFALGTGTALAMSPPPPEPSPEPVIPQIDPKPETPDLSIGLSDTDIKLSWYATQDAEYYPVYAYTGGQWRHMENISGTRATYDHKQHG